MVEGGRGRCDEEERGVPAVFFHSRVWVWVCLRVCLSGVRAMCACDLNLRFKDREKRAPVVNTRTHSRGGWKKVRDGPIRHSHTRPSLSTCPATCPPRAARSTFRSWCGVVVRERGRECIVWVSVWDGWSGHGRAPGGEGGRLRGARGPAPGQAVAPTPARARSSWATIQPGSHRVADGSVVSGSARPRPLPRSPPPPSHHSAGQIDRYARA